MNLNKDNVHTILNKIAKRRNQIVHEADLVRKIKGKKITLREIKYSDTKNDIEFLEKFVESVDEIINN
jgi:hypothetical protein